MSDALLTRIAEAVEGLRADLKKSAPAGGAVVPKAAAGGAPKPDAAAAKAAADTKAKAEAETKARAAAAATAAAAKAAAAPKGTAPVAGTKAPGGKFTVDQVRDKIREVATNPGLGRQSASDILDQDGGGVKSVKDLKPENYDKVYEACQVALQSEGSAPAEPEDDLM